MSFQIGQIVECVEKPGWLDGFCLGREYAVCRTEHTHGADYITILGEDNKAHTLLEAMFRATPPTPGAS